MTIFPSARYSPATNFDTGRRRNGFVKFHLGHSRMGSVFVVEQIFIANGREWLFYQPSFFGPPNLSFFSRTRGSAEFSADVVSPRGSDATRLLLKIDAKGLKKNYADGAVMYSCEITSQGRLDRQAAGQARQLSNGDFALRLYHHTDDAGFNGITSSRYFRASAWNLQGVRQLANISHVYFTTLPSIESEKDLSRIAMSGAGELHFQTTEEEDAVRAIGMTVYRGDTATRTRTVSVDVPVGALAPPQLYYHPIVGRDPAYYEVIGPEILRVPLIPGRVLPLRKRAALISQADLKVFNYVVMGHAGTPEGLAAPYHEEDTEEVMFLEELGGSAELFTFWQEHANSDLVTGRHREVRLLADPAVCLRRRPPGAERELHEDSVHF